MLTQTSISARIKVEGHSAPRQGRRWGGISVFAEGQTIRGVWTRTASASRRKRPAPKNGAPTFCLLSAANRSADITLAQSMAYVEKLLLQARKMAVLAIEKAPLSAISPLCIQGAGQPGPGAVKESVRQPIGPDEVRFTADGVSMSDAPHLAVKGTVCERGRTGGLGDPDAGVRE
jgi:hypothetical protein